MMDIDFTVASIAQNPDCIFVLLFCCLHACFMFALASGACMVHDVYVYLIYLPAVQGRMQPSRDTTYFVVRM